MIVYRFEIAGTCYDHNGLICGISDALGIDSLLDKPSGLSGINYMIDEARDCIERLGDPDNEAYIPVPSMWWSSSRDLFCFFTLVGIKRCDDIISKLANISILTSHPVILWSIDTSLIDKEMEKYSDPYQVVIRLDEDGWKRYAKNLFEFTTARSINAAIRMIKGVYKD